MAQKKKNLMNLLKNFLFFIIIVFLIAFIAIILLMKFNTNSNLNFFTVLSGSMEPQIPSGSLILTRVENEYNINDVITFVPTPETQVPITHRIINIERKNDEVIYYSKGDANNAPDNIPVTKNQILGKIIFTIPFLGKLFAYAKTQTGFILLVILPASLIIISEIVSMKKEITILKKNNEKTLS